MVFCNHIFPESVKKRCDLAQLIGWHCFVKNLQRLTTSLASLHKTLQHKQLVATTTLSLRIQVLLLLLPLAWASALSFSETMVVQRLRITTDTVEHARNLGTFATTCGNMLDQILSIEKRPNHFIEIKKVESIENQDKSAFRYSVQFTKDTSMTTFTYDIMKNLVRRRVRENFGKQGVNETQLENFLATALCWRRLMLMQQQTMATLDMNYTIVKTQYDAGFFPKVHLLCEAPISPECPALFKLYAMHCEVLLRCLEALPGHRGKLLKRMIELELSGKKAGDALEQAIHEIASSSLNTQQWFENSTIKIFRKAQKTSQLDELIERIQELETFQVVNAVNLDAVSIIPLDELPKAHKDLRIDTGAITRRSIVFKELQQDAPLLLHPALNSFSNALMLLAEGKEEAFLSSLTKARKLFQEAVAKQKEVENALDTAERNTSSFQKRYSLTFDVLDKYRKMEEELFPWE